ncbi:D-alanine--D-alanine ligase [Opitutales bacterium ASA1]|uniref:D-alanine--D-alanine ligase family protein n=1 Tax=Congregicoccus parvus TaxID=3081749 RepID=UPI002B2F10B3|nr:D-alanine--D-alanine ligase [Opitutales bacterium ASA1]
MSEPVLVVFRGGISPEREVSLGSGAAALASLRRSFPEVIDCEIATREVPEWIVGGTHVVFSTLHGVFGEDGGMQALLEARGVACCGCDAAASAHCFDKQRTKETVSAVGVPVARGTLVSRADVEHSDEIFARFGPHLVIKPNRQGSSVGLAFVDTPEALRERIAACGDDGCVVEQRIEGREVTVGVLDGLAMGVVEIRPKSGQFDYASKYTKGLTEYLAPAPFDLATTALLQRHAELAFKACGCRDFARVDFMVGPSGPVLLEINTLPGLKETSLLPMSAKCEGLDFDALVRRMILPAIERNRAARPAERNEDTTR